MKILIVDGISETRLEYKKLIQRIDTSTEIFEATSAEDALFMTLDHNPDVIFVSEILSFRSGFELARILKKSKDNIPIIVVANDETNALEAIRSNVFDFITLPIVPERLEDTLKKAVTHIDYHLKLNNGNKYKTNIKVRISTNSGYKLIDLDQLTYCIADGSYTNIYFENGESVFSSYYLGKIEKVLAPYHFVKVNRSVIVNLKMITTIDKKREVCVLECDGELKEFKITRMYIKKMEEENIL